MVPSSGVTVVHILKVNTITVHAWYSVATAGQSEACADEHIHAHSKSGWAAEISG